MKTAWEKYKGKKIKTVHDFSEGYKDWLNGSKTEREAVRESVKLAEKAGFRELKTFRKLKANDKVYVNNRGKSLLLFVIGSKDIEEGLNILGAHIDSPRIDIKQNPVYETGGLAYLDTHYYGGIKKYQWVAQQLAMHGVVVLKDGTVKEIVIGEKENDPVLGISDLLPHLGKDQMSKKASEVIPGENLDILAASIPKYQKGEELKEPVKENFLDLLKKDYGFEEEDFISAELEVVPAGKVRDYGFDRSMVIGYGQDDRICGYTSLKAILDTDAPERTSACILTDKEEVGSQGSTGAQSRFFENSVAEVIERLGGYSDLKLRRCLEHSRMISSDVSAAFDPLFAEVYEAKNAAYFGKGLVFNKYLGGSGKSGSNDADAEYLAKLRKVMEDNDVFFQTAEIGKVDQGGGGTIAKFSANLNMDVIDAGIAVQNMHGCYETASKVDIYEGYRGYKAFLKDMK